MIFEVSIPEYCRGLTYTKKKKYSLFIWNLNATVYPVFYLTILTEVLKLWQEKNPMKRNLFQKEVWEVNSETSLIVSFSLQESSVELSCPM